MEWSIQEVARSTGVTSRTLRHYDAVGLLRPVRVANGGQRIYDSAGLLRLQRILLLRGLGVGLARIARVLDESAEIGSADVLEEHLEVLRREHDRLARQITAVENRSPH